MILLASGYKNRFIIAAGNLRTRMEITAENIKNIYALAPMQEGMLFHWLANRGSPAYFQQLAYQVAGSLDSRSFQDAWSELARRHDILRTIFVHTQTERPVQVVLKERAATVAFQDLRGLAPEAQRAFRNRFKEADRTKAFDLGRDMLMRLSVLQIEEQRYEMVWSHHHILLDGWSAGILQKEFLTIYTALKEGKCPDLPPAIPYSRYIKWRETRDFAASRQFWKDALAGYDAVATVPQAAVQRPAGGRQEFSFSLGTELSRALASISARHGVTLNTILESLWAILLARYNNVSDVVFGKVVSGRPAGIPGIEEAVGLFINTIPVRIRPLAERTFADLLAEVQRDALAAEPHHYLPLAEAQAASPLSHQLIGTLYSLENFPAGEEWKNSGRAGTGLVVESAEIFEQTHYEFDIQFIPEEAIRVKISFDSGRHDTEVIRRIEGHLINAARAVAMNDRVKIGGIDLLTEPEKEEQFKVASSATAPAPNRTLVEWFERQVLRAPDAMAVSFEGRGLTYRQLNERANQLARHLRALGVGPEVLVGLCLDRSLEMLNGILGILKAGGAYVPIDTASPGERITFILEDARAPVLLTESSQRPRFSALESALKIVSLDSTPGNFAGESLENPDHQGGPGNAAYVIYTSGSTGQPKGVVVTHHNVTRLFTSTEPWFGFGPSDVWTLFHSCAFDFSVWEIWGAWLYGGRLIVVPYELSRSPEAFRELLWKEKVTVLNQTPSAFRQFLAADALADQSRALSLRYVIFGGEALDLPILRPWFDRHSDRSPRLVNMYGITETTVHVTWRPLSRADLESKGSLIGKPIPDLALYILDDQLRPTPLGVRGEIYVAGEGLARGYLHRPELTAERFIHFTLPGGRQQRLYRTGDAARYLPGGDLEYAGRLDQQIKIRGFRVEPGEIAGALARHAAVRENAVLLRPGRTGEKQLVAYVAFHPGAAVAPAHLRAFLQNRLPEWMVPASFVILDALPLTTNGKIDTRSLPPPDESGLGRESEYLAPRTEAEKVLATVWGEVLKFEPIGVHDNYFSLGGDSIKAIQILSRLLREQFKIEIRDLFRHPTVAELAPLMTPVKERGKKHRVSGPAALTPIQERFFAEQPIDRHHFNHAVLLRSREALRPEAVHAAVTALYRGHDSLRLRFWQAEGEGRWLQEAAAADSEPEFRVVDLGGSAEPERDLARQAALLQAGFDLVAGPLMKVMLFRIPEGDRLLLVIHHLAVDAVSWRVLFEELGQVYRQAVNDRVRADLKATSLPGPTATELRHVDETLGGLLPLPGQRSGERAGGEGFVSSGLEGASSPRPSPPLRRGEGELEVLPGPLPHFAEEERETPIRLPERTDSYLEWAQGLVEHSQSAALRGERAYWAALDSIPSLLLPSDHPVPPANLYGDARIERIELTAEQTRLVLLDANQAYQTTAEDLLLVALGRAFRRWLGTGRMLIALEGHGRAEAIGGLDISRTTGWFTAVYPFLLDLPADRDIGYQIKSVKEALRQVPHGGIGYGLLRYLGPPEEPVLGCAPAIGFNYLGTIDGDLAPDLFSLDPADTGEDVSPRARRSFELEFSAVVSAGRMELSVLYNRRRFESGTLRQLLGWIAGELEQIVEHCRARETPELTPSDLTYREISLDELEGIIS